MEIEFAVNFGQGAGNVPPGSVSSRSDRCSSPRTWWRSPSRTLCGDHVLVASEQVLGNGQVDSIQDVVYVKPDAFSAKDTWLIAAELDEMNRRLLEANRPYLLVVLGRLGTSDPWLGIPVKWGQVSGAKVVVEASSAGMNVDMSQGSHFFHNVTCLRILYFSTDKTERYPVKWEWLENQKVVRESQFVRHVALEEPLHVKVDGKSGRGVISYERADSVGDQAAGSPHRAGQGAHVPLCHRGSFEGDRTRTSIRFAIVSSRPSRRDGSSRRSAWPRSLSKEQEYRSKNFEETPWKLSANIVQQDQVVGTISVYYTQETPGADVGPFPRGREETHRDHCRSTQPLPDL